MKKTTAHTANTLLLSGERRTFPAALNDLDKRDSVGVARWCANGDATLDLKPTLDRDAAISALGEILKPFDFDTPPPSQPRKGELALQKMVRLIIDVLTNEIRSPCQSR